MTYTAKEKTEFRKHGANLPDHLKFWESPPCHEPDDDPDPSGWKYMGDREKKEIRARYIACRSVSQAAKESGRAVSTVAKLVSDLLPPDRQRSGTKIGAKEAAKIARIFKATDSLRETAKKSGRSLNGVKSALDRAGVTRHRRKRNG